MPATTVHLDRDAPRARYEGAVAATSMHEVHRDTPGILMPRPESQIVVRFGPMARGGLDVYAIGARQRVHRKTIRGGQRTLIARLRLGTDLAVLGVPACAIAGQTVALEDLWGSASRRLLDRLSAASDMSAAAEVLESAIAQRVLTADVPHAHSRVALEAARRLARADVETVAADLGISARHLRRVFREAVGVGPKAFARLERFRDALRIARERDEPHWADVAADVGYYDQAHLIAEFRAISGATPNALVKELRAGPGIG